MAIVITRLCHHIETLVHVKVDTPYSVDTQRPCLYNVLVIQPFSGTAGWLIGGALNKMCSFIKTKTISAENFI